MHRCLDLKAEKLQKEIWNQLGTVAVFIINTICSIFILRCPNVIVSVHTIQHSQILIYILYIYYGSKQKKKFLKLPIVPDDSHLQGKLRGPHNLGLKWDAVPLKKCVYVCVSRGKRGILV